MYEDESKQFVRLLGKEHKFFGVDNNCFKLGNQVFEAVENEDDGYRSYLNSVPFREDWKKFGLIFHRLSFARVRLEEYDDGYFEGYRLVDVDHDHEWLRFGTDNYDDYYPCFIFEYKARAA